MLLLAHAQTADKSSLLAGLRLACAKLQMIMPSADDADTGSNAYSSTLHKKSATSASALASAKTMSVLEVKFTCQCTATNHAPPAAANSRATSTPASDPIF